MKLNQKQKELCLKHAMGEIFASWKGTPQEACQRLWDLYEKSPETDNFEEAADVQVCGLYEYHYLSDIIDKVDSAIYANEAFIKEAFRLKTRSRKKREIQIVVQGGMVQEVKNLPSGCTCWVNDLD